MSNFSECDGQDRIADDDDGTCDISSATCMVVREMPVRVWHWLNALSIVVLVITGYLIGVPLPTTSGEPSEWYVMGYIRFAHFAASYLFTVGLLFRIWWGLVGNHYARELFYLPIWRRSWISGLWHQLRWQFLIEPEARLSVGYNPLARCAICLFFVIPSLIMILTGFAMYSEATGRDSWEHFVFGWIVEFWRNTQDIHTIHRLGMWVLLIFSIIHIYIVIHDDIMSKQSVISAMFSGEQFIRTKR